MGPKNKIVSAMFFLSRYVADTILFLGPVDIYFFIVIIIGNLKCEFYYVSNMIYESESFISAYNKYKTTNKVI